MFLYVQSDPRKEGKKTDKKTKIGFESSIYASKD